MHAIADSILNSIQQHAEWAWLVVFIIAFAESMAIIGLLVPGWALLLGIGTLIGADVLEFFPIVVSAYLGAVIGEYLSFYVGYHYHEPILKWKLIARHQHLIESTREFFEKHGATGVFFGRFIGPIRAVIPLVAGISEMPKRTFFWVNLTSGIIWAPLYLIPGILVGAAYNLDREVSTAIVFIFTILALVLWMAIKQTRMLYKVLSGELERSRGFAVVNALLAWLVFIVLWIIVMQSEYYVSIQAILQLVWGKLY